MTELGPQEQFVQTLYLLNKTMKQLFESGNVSLFTEMNTEIKELYRLQHGSKDIILQSIETECGIIYNNFDMIIAVLRTTENGEIDRGAQAALNKFLHNIDDAVVQIVKALSLA